jgi:SAM-dependent methyltransferase
MADWRAANRANWDERVPVHVASAIYDASDLRAGRGTLNPIEEAELGPVAGLRVLHLQCHFGMDTLTLAQRGADVVGLDFSGPAIEQARRLASELGLADRARFVHADVYDAPAAVGRPQDFDLVFTTWGTIGWLPDIEGWAEVVTHFLAPGGALYFADGHPAALVLDDAAATADGMPGFFVPYFQREPLVMVDHSDYADDQARIESGTQYSWMHPVSAILGALMHRGLRLDFLHEHERVPWRMFKTLVKDSDGMWRWPDKTWLPLSLSLRASRPR